MTPHWHDMCASLRVSYQSDMTCEILWDVKMGPVKCQTKHELVGDANSYLTWLRLGYWGHCVTCAAKNSDRAKYFWQSPGMHQEQIPPNLAYALLASGLPTCGNNPRLHNRWVGMFRDQQTFNFQNFNVQLFHKHFYVSGSLTIAGFYAKLCKHDSAPAWEFYLTSRHAISIATMLGCRADKNLLLLYSPWLAFWIFPGSFHLVKTDAQSC